MDKLTLNCTVIPRDEIEVSRDRRNAEVWLDMSPTTRSVCLDEAGIRKLRDGLTEFLIATGAEKVAEAVEATEPKPETEAEKCRRVACDLGGAFMWGSDPAGADTFARAWEALVARAERLEAEAAQPSALELARAEEALGEGAEAEVYEDGDLRIMDRDGDTVILEEGDAIALRDKLNAAYPA